MIKDDLIVANVIPSAYVHNLLENQLILKPTLGAKGLFTNT